MNGTTTQTKTKHPDHDSPRWIVAGPDGSIVYDVLGNHVAVIDPAGEVIDAMGKAYYTRLREYVQLDDDGAIFAALTDLYRTRLAENINAEAVEAVIADREAQASSPEVAGAVAFMLEMELRPWFGPRSIPEEHLRRIAGRLMGRAAWIRPAAPGCDCSATGGHGLNPSPSREHADDCPAVAR